LCKLRSARVNHLGLSTVVFSFVYFSLWPILKSSHWSRHYSLALKIQSLALTLEPDRILLRLFQFHYSSVVQNAGITFMFHGSTCGTLDLQSENAEENYYRHDMATLTNLGVIFADNFTPVFHPRPCTMTVPNFPLLLIPSSMHSLWLVSCYYFVRCGTVQNVPRRSRTVRQ